MEFLSALDAEDYALGQAMSSTSMFYPHGTPSAVAGSFSDPVPAGTTPQFSNGWGLDTFTAELNKVSGAIHNVVTSVYGGINAVQNARVAQVKAGASRDIEVARAHAEVAKAQAGLSGVDLAALDAKLRASAWSSYEIVMLAIAGLGLWFAVKKRRR